MTPYEMMLSESQERMLMVLKPGREAEAEAIFRKWELDFAVIGEVTDTGHMVLEFNGEVVCDIPLGPLADEAPCYERPYAIPKPPEPLTDIPESTDIAADLLKLMASPNLASRRWVWEQYDQSVGADTVQRPGGDAAVVRVHGSKKALAITTDCTPRYCYADPVEGGKQAVAEAYRNLCAVGAKPLAITNCLNFGNPQRPEIMGQFVGCVEGMAEACRALDFPVVSGNVSLYNETKNEDGSQPRDPADAGDRRRRTARGLGEVGDDRLQGRGRAAHPDRRDHDQATSASRSGSTCCHGRRDGPPPPVDLDVERRAGELIRELIDARLGDRSPRRVGRRRCSSRSPRWRSPADIGARLSRLPQIAAKSCARSCSAKIRAATSSATARSRRMVERHRAANAASAAAASARPAATRLISIDGPGGRASSLADLRAAHEGFFPKLMGSELTPEF